MNVGRWLTSDNCYLLSDGITSLKSTPCYTPERETIQGVQKRRGKKQSGRAGHCRNDQTEEKTQQGEQMVVICGQFKVQESQNLVIEDQNLAEEPHTETYEEPYVLQAREEELQNVLIGDHDELEGKTMDSEHLEATKCFIFHYAIPLPFPISVTFLYVFFSLLIFYFNNFFPH